MDVNRFGTFCSIVSDGSSPKRGGQIDMINLLLINSSWQVTLFLAGPMWETNVRSHGRWMFGTWGPTIILKEA